MRAFFSCWVRVLFLSLFVLLAAAGLSSCRPAAPPSSDKDEKPVSWSLLEGEAVKLWQPAGIPDESHMSVQAGVLTLPAGQPMTGAKWTGWNEQLPGTNYAIEYEAMRAEGEDIFGMVTFPVGSHQSHATFVLGGWGGTVTGISSIDFKDANENQTRAEQRFENGRWYKVRIEVRPDDLRAWVEGRLVVNATIKGKKVRLRPGFIDHCLPFGFASYGTTGKIRRVVLETLN